MTWSVRDMRRAQRAFDIGARRAPDAIDEMRVVALGPAEQLDVEALVEALGGGVDLERVALDQVALHRAQLARAQAVRDPRVVQAELEFDACARRLCAAGNVCIPTGRACATTCSCCSRRS